MKKITEIIFVIDKSGSMKEIEEEMINGYNNFINTFKDIKVTTVLFNQDSNILFDNNEGQEALLSCDIYNPSGSTALLDAVGKAIQTLEKRYESIHRVPAVQFIIITDGKENSSHQFTYNVIKKMITKCKKQKWQFVLLAANIDIYKECERIGLDKNEAITFDTTKYGIANMFEGLITYIQQRH